MNICMYENDYYINRWYTSTVSISHTHVCPLLLFLLIRILLLLLLLLRQRCFFFFFFFFNFLLEEKRYIKALVWWCWWGCVLSCWSRISIHVYSDRQPFYNETEIKSSYEVPWLIFSRARNVFILFIFLLLTILFSINCKTLSRIFFLVFILILFFLRDLRIIENE